MLSRFHALITLMLTGVQMWSCTASKDSAQRPGAMYDFSVEQELGAGDSLSIARTFIDGLRAKALGDFEGAISYFGQVVNADPENDAALYELGRIYFEYGRLEEASELLRQAASLDKANPYYQEIYGSILVYLANYKEAVAVFEHLLTLIPDDRDAWLELAIAYEKAGSMHEAIRVFSEMETKFGPGEDLLLEQYRLYVRGGMLEAAVEVLNRLIANSPEEPMFYGMLAELYEMAGETEKAREAFAKLLEADPYNPDLLFKQADYLLLAGDEAGYLATLQQVFDDPDANIDRKVFFLIPFTDSIDIPGFSRKEMVLDLAQRMLNAHPEEAKAYALNADILFYSGLTDQARQNYLQSTGYRADVYDVWVKLFNIDAGAQAWDSLQAVTTRSIELFPNQALGYFFRGIAYAGKKENDEAIRQLKRALPMAVGNDQLRAEIWLRLGDVYHDMQDHAKSDDAYDQCLTITPNNPYALNNYAYYLSLRKVRLDDAEKMAEKANRLVPANPSLLDTWAWVMYQQEDYSRAKELLEQALKAGGEGSAVVLEHYGDTLYRLGQKEEALEYWKKAAEIGEPPASLKEKINSGAL
jgi:tetratricopeptide (TPR) repeat protein